MYLTVVDCWLAARTSVFQDWSRAIDYATRRFNSQILPRRHRCTVVQVSVYFAPMDIDKLFKVLYARRSVLSLVYIKETSGTKNPHRGKQTAHARRTTT